MEQKTTEKCTLCRLRLAQENQLVAEQVLREVRCLSSTSILPWVSAAVRDRT